MSNTTTTTVDYKSMTCADQFKHNLEQYSKRIGDIEFSYNHERNESFPYALDLPEFTPNCKHLHDSFITALKKSTSHITQFAAPLNQLILRPNDIELQILKQKNNLACENTMEIFFKEFDYVLKRNVNHTTAHGKVHEKLRLNPDVRSYTNCLDVCNVVDIQQALVKRLKERGFKVNAKIIKGDKQEWERDSRFMWRSYTPDNIIVDVDYDY
jgi:hypothetical protein